MKVKFFSNYETSANLLNRFNNNYIISDDKLTFTTGHDYDVAVVFNKTEEVIKDNTKIITVIQEPSWSPVHQGNDFLTKSDFLIIHHTHEFEKKHLKVSAGQIIESPSIMWYHDHIEKGYFLNANRPRKTRKLSIIVSGINLPIGNYQKRINLLLQILQSNLDIDIYGRGLPIQDRRYKGEINYKFIGLDKYQYSICIENSNEMNYVTEKFIDPLLCLTKPLYVGAPNISEIYSPLCYNLLNLDSPTIIDDIKLLTEETPDLEILKINRDSYFNNYNLYDKIRDIVC